MEQFVRYVNNEIIFTTLAPIYSIELFSNLVDYNVTLSPFFWDTREYIMNGGSLLFLENMDLNDEIKTDFGGKMISIDLLDYYIKTAKGQRKKDKIKKIKYSFLKDNILFASRTLAIENPEIFIEKKKRMSELLSKKYFDINFILATGNLAKKNMKN
jgi:hypothetical protein